MLLDCIAENSVFTNSRFFFIISLGGHAVRGQETTANQAIR